jgi:hypothetical protein
MKNRDCPVCDPWLRKLAEEVPFSHHVNSTIVCRLSGKIMDEDNAPMAFPNGYVYSREVRLGLVLFCLAHHLGTRTGFGRYVGAKRGQSQMSAHTGRVRVLQVEKGIHILIPVFLTTLHHAAP